MYNQFAKRINAIDISKLVSKTGCSAKIIDIEGNIYSVSHCLKKTDYNAKINEIQGIITNVSNLVKKRIIML